MIEDEAPQLHDPHETWWKVPLAASLPGLPLLAWEFSLFQADGYTSGINRLILTGFCLFAIAWLLPHRQSQRTLRTAISCTALVFAVLPLTLALLLTAAMASG
ncbi:hypothetical protein [Streptomyces monashensis]|uniref:Uncharacterized protein n=1 Tax=Streptomyces monashensis TaxID=1678012 RepID=A0A1S2NTX0_9ACTN|nr:hypothetical protein [Streptomyces monashensis]OIJ84626.1 hypothetical protein BIV23_45165 [Streptomyces monashensis]